MRHKLSIVLLSLAIALGVPAAAYPTASSVHVTARSQPKVQITIVSASPRAQIRVKSNKPWLLVAEEAGRGGRVVNRQFEGRATGDSGRLLSLEGRLVRFSAVLLP